MGSENVKIATGQSLLEQARKQRSRNQRSPAHYKKEMVRSDGNGIGIGIGADLTSPCRGCKVNTIKAPRDT